MRRDTDGCTLDSGRVALALRGLRKPASYPFVERQLWRRRAAGLFLALKALRGQGSQPERSADLDNKRQRRCAIAAQPPPALNCPSCNRDRLRPHIHSDGERQWLTTQCAKCGWVDTTSWIEKRRLLKEGRGMSRGPERPGPD
jgi:hypothetical protein